MLWIYIYISIFEFYGGLAYALKKPGRSGEKNLVEKHQIGVCFTKWDEEIRDKIVSWEANAQSSNQSNNSRWTVVCCNLKSYLRYQTRDEITVVFAIAYVKG
ncbi:hypothetical protein CDL12_19640 [Handroanthus impetiginosus]|uniref:Uncharacterized protein n=1 Tax=Handroanthus impetiginosus TaxID=429701 RepID=A0A2G9GR71_9LAMI|nr:hypothetical protein CDL12_19640 [Handroanthus impetiginosus]